MKVSNTNLSPPGAAGAAGAQQTQRPSHVGGSPNGPSSGSSSSTDAVSLSGLAHSVRAQAVDSPERQAKVDQLTKAYASGTYAVDSHATASAIIEDASKR